MSRAHPPGSPEDLYFRRKAAMQAQMNAALNPFSAEAMAGVGVMDVAEEDLARDDGAAAAMTYGDNDDNDDDDDIGCSPDGKPTCVGRCAVPGGCVPRPGEKKEEPQHQPQQQQQQRQLRYSPPSSQAASQDSRQPASPSRFTAAPSLKGVLAAGGSSGAANAAAFMPSSTLAMTSQVFGAETAVSKVSN